MQVGEHDHHRTHAQVRLGERDQRQRRIVTCSRRIELVERSGEAHVEEEAVSDAGDSLRRRRLLEHRRNRAETPPLGDVGRIVGMDAGAVAQRLADRPPHVRLAVGHATALEHGGLVVGLGQRRGLLGEPALADARLADQQHELRPAVLHRHVDAPPDEAELGTAADEGRPQPAGPMSGRCDRLERDPRLDRFLPTAGLHRTEMVVAHDLVGGRVRRPARRAPGRDGRPICSRFAVFTTSPMAV